MDARLAMMETNGGSLYGTVSRRRKTAEPASRIILLILARHGRSPEKSAKMMD
jgi:hypothetical protein